MNRLPPDDTTMSLCIDPHPPKSGPEIYILRLKANEKFSFQVFSPDIFGIWVHWSGAKSTPHFTDTGRCPGCRNEDPMRWKGFVHAHCIEKKQDVFLELTPASANSLRDQLGVGETLRGKCIFVNRTKGDNGRLLIRVMQGHLPSDALPPALDPQKSIMALWGIREKAPQGGMEFPTHTLNGFSPKKG